MKRIPLASRLATALSGAREWVSVPTADLRDAMAEPRVYTHDSKGNPIPLPPIPRTLPPVVAGSIRDAQRRCDEARARWMVARRLETFRDAGADVEAARAGYVERWREFVEALRRANAARTGGA